MRYGFVRLKNDDDTFVYMEVREFYRYSCYDVFNSHADRLIIFDNIYIASFPLLSKLKDIVDFNPDILVFDVFLTNDRGNWLTYAKNLGCVNV